METLFIVMCCMIIMATFLIFGILIMGKNNQVIQNYELREIEYTCKLIDSLYNNLTDEQKKQFWGGNQITKIPPSLFN